MYQAQTRIMQFGPSPFLLNSLFLRMGSKIRKKIALKNLSSNFGPIVKFLYVSWSERIDLNDDTTWKIPRPMVISADGSFSGVSELSPKPTYIKQVALALILALLCNIWYEKTDEGLGYHIS